MIKFWGQPKYAGEAFFAYELFLREQVASQWRVPTDFGQFSAAELAALLGDTIIGLQPGIEMVSLNLDQPEFVRADFLVELPRVQAAYPDLQVCVELTERPYGVSLSALAAAAQAYQAGGLWVCLDDVGTGANDPTLARALAPYTQEFKFALQNYHDQKDFVTLVAPLLQFWREQAKLYGKFFAIEGFETKQDLVIARNYKPDILQGYYFGKPQPL